MLVGFCHLKAHRQADLFANLLDFNIWPICVMTKSFVRGIERAVQWKQKHYTQNINVP